MYQFNNDKYDSISCLPVDYPQLNFPNINHAINKIIFILISAYRPDSTLVSSRGTQSLLNTARSTNSRKPETAQSAKPPANPSKQRLGWHKKYGCR